MDSNPNSFNATILIEFLRYALTNNLGVIPDPIEPWFSRRAIASIMGYSDKTFANNKFDYPDIAHPSGNFYRLGEYVERYTNEKRNSD